MVLNRLRQLKLRHSPPANGYLCPMEFQNNVLQIDELPKAEMVPLEPLEPAYLKLMQWRWAILWTMVLIVASVAWAIFLNMRIWALAMGSAIVFFALISLLLLRKSFFKKGFAIREKDILYQSGWLVTELQVCPFNRIQHCSVEAGWLERKFGLAGVSVFTAGSSDGDITIPGLPQQKADSLRALITGKIVEDGLA